MAITLYKGPFLPTDIDLLFEITGLVETLDGSLERQPFAGLDQLGTVLNRLIDKPSKKNRARTKPRLP